MRPAPVPANDHTSLLSAGFAPLAQGASRAWAAAFAAQMEMALWPIECWALTLGAMTRRNEGASPETPSLACAMADVVETRNAVLATRDDFLRALSR